MRRRTALRLAGASACAGLLALAGCAVTPTGRPVTGPRWSGRLALQVEGQPEQSFTAGFDLRGAPGEGELELFTPIGTRAALLQWWAGRARLDVPGQPPRAASSLEELITRATGTTIPVRALFDWLAGIPSPAAGWQADLSQHADGRLSAHRLGAPAAHLRVILEAP